MDRENKHTIEIRDHELTVDESSYTHDNEEHIDTIVRVTSNDRLNRTIAIHIDHDGEIAVFVRGLGVTAGNIQKKTRSLHGRKFVVLSPKLPLEPTNNDCLDRVFIDA